MWNWTHVAFYFVEEHAVAVETDSDVTILLANGTITFVGKENFTDGELC